MNEQRPVNWFAAPGRRRRERRTDGRQAHASSRESWAKELEVLNPVLDYRGVPYQDNEATGTALNESGRQLERDVNAALRTSRRVLPLLDGEFTAIATELQATNIRSATRVAAGHAVGHADRARLGGAGRRCCSAPGSARNAICGRRASRPPTFCALSKTDCSCSTRIWSSDRPIPRPWKRCFSATTSPGCPSRACSRTSYRNETLTTALKFVKVLWSERTNEKLVKIDQSPGRSGSSPRQATAIDTRYLQFDFHRVRVDGEMTHVLVSVSDVSARVDLARELQSSQSQAQGQVDTLLGILHIDPAQLRLVPERHQCGHENDQRRAARADARGRACSARSSIPCSGRCTR